MKPNNNNEKAEDGSTVEARNEDKEWVDNNNVGLLDGGITPPPNVPVVPTTLTPNQHLSSIPSSARVGRVDGIIEREVQKLTAQCRFLDETRSSKDNENDAIEVIPRFHRNELWTGALLGSGAFSEVYEIWGFRCSEEGNQDPLQEEARFRMQVEPSIDRQGKCRYVVKHLTHYLLPNQNSKYRFIHAASDLVMEALFLSKLNHPNIIKLRGCAHGISSYKDGSHDAFFLVLDRLDCTLSQKIMKWTSIPLERKRVLSRNILDYGHKVDIALQIARGLDYLHDRDIIFRDLKPDNIGFLADGTVQIFDFGLCRELPEECPVDDKLFRMSGVGTRRYMAPEIFLGQEYNLKADVYSFTMVFHALLSLQRPYEHYNAAFHRILVCQDGLRPVIASEWPEEVRELCRTGWAAKPNDRPSIKDVRQRLQRFHNKIVEVQLAPRSNFVEKSLEMLDSVTQHLCEDTKTLNKHAGNVLRLLEMHMVEGASSAVRAHRSADHPQTQHLRSHYL